MGNLYDKTNAPYLIAGTFAALTLLASGTLAVAPYVAFLSPIAAFNVALPVALSLSILSILVLALSCKIISNNKKIEVEKNKFAEKGQELESVKQQFESKVQELENEITLGKEAARKEVEELNNQLNELTQEKQGLEKEVVELKVKVKGQLKHREEMISFEHQELRDENTKLNERVDSLMEELCQCKSESEENKLRLRSEYKDKLNSELECKSREASSLKTQLAMLRGKVKKLEEEGESKNCTSSFVRDESILAEKRNLAKKLNQEKDKNKELESVLNNLNINYDNQRDKNFGLLKENEELKEELSSLKAEKEELVNESIRAENDHEEDVNKFEAKKREYVTKVVFTVLSVVKERVEEGLFNSAEQQHMQDTDPIQEGVDEFMQPIYGKLNIDNQQKFNYCPTMLEQLQDLLTAPCTQLADLGYTSRYFTPTDSYRTF